MMSQKIERPLVIIAGCGDVGESLAYALSDDKRDIVMIDNDPCAFSNIMEKYHITTVVADASDIDVLDDYGIKRAESFFAVTNNENLNIMIAEIASEIYHVPKVFIRTYKADKKNWLLQNFHIVSISETAMMTDEFQREYARNG